MLVKACAKVNLTLEIGKRRPDGYHSLRSIVCPVSVCDSITIEQAEEGGINFQCSDKSIPGEKNTAFRAARLFSEKYAPGLNLRIRLEKNIPSQAGLGGGSSDASAVLLALDRLCKTSLSQTELVSLAASLGSDMPFFIFGGVCLMEGRGEIITPLPDCFPMDIIILKPAAGVSTGEAYEALDRRKDTGVLKSPSRLPATKEEFLAMGFNDFEEVCFLLTKEIPRAVSLLRDSGACFTLLCGSGSAVMGVYDDREAQKKGLDHLQRKTTMTAYPCRTLGRKDCHDLIFGEHS
ncbi:MAG: 4-(cytidine 5'-diphospho)-2-C-methyl-D-erythritol kinase [Abditibacteriota bacterium]|nr:4-(cytidine 5'-diphospho)-2-C-methyl-D-erythritol kinase [Abditibacteriota bacterium]